MRLGKIIKTSLFATALLTIQAASAGQKSDNWQQYQSLMNDISSNLAQAPLSDIKSQAEKLARISTSLLPAFVAKQPVCADYINAALAASETMLTLSLEDIERDYHADGKLPPMKQAVCYHAKDLLVHPATVAVIASTSPDSPQTRNKLAHELEEVLEHFNEVKRNSGL